MAKHFVVLAVLALTLVSVQAEPARFRGRKIFLARQEAAPQNDPAAAAPYPAAGVTPEVPFDLPTETEAPAAQPDVTYGPPDNTYGPPDNTYGPPPADAVAPQPDNTYGPPADDSAVPLPDNTYGPPDAVEPAIDDPAAAVEEPLPNNLVAQNLIQPRNNRLRFRARPVSQRLRTAPANLVEIIRSKPILVYTLE